MVLEHAIAHRAAGRKEAVLAVRDGTGWTLSHAVSGAGDRELEASQARKYDNARTGGSRGNLGPRPPRSAVEIVTIDLDGRQPQTWMEIRRPSNTENLGQELHASREKSDGSRKPAFDRVLSVIPGDRVLHWWHRSIVGVSIVAELPFESNDAAVALLRDFVRFDSPVTLDDLRQQEDAVIGAFQETRDDPRWSQFPFQVYNAETDAPTLHGAQQQYFVGVPPELIDAVIGLRARLNAAGDVVDLNPAEMAPAEVRPAFEADPERRRAVEVHAEDVVIQELMRDGFTDIERVGKPYDLRAIRADAELHVEVKGSSIRADAVVLTRNEVTHAADHSTSLFVVDEIDVRLGESGYHCSGGRIRRWDTWEPSSEDLQPLQYSYVLPREYESKR